MTHRAFLAVLLLWAGLTATPLVGADGQMAPVVVVPKPLPIEAIIDAVTLYQGRAAVTRTAKPTMPSGVWELRFEELPATLVADSLQATVAAPAKLLDVRSEETTLASDHSNDPEVVATLKELEAWRVSSAQLAGRQQTLRSSLALLDAMGSKIADQTGKSLGTDTIDPAKLKLQIDSIASQRDEIAAKLLLIDEELRRGEGRRQALAAKVVAIGSSSRTQRTGVVVVAMPSDAAPIDVSLTYLVNNATWRPTYSIRAAADLTGLQIDYDATILQKSGEPWNDVRLTLSTAQPTRAAEPATLEPISVDVAPAEYGKSLSVAESAAPPKPMSSGFTGAAGAFSPRSGEKDAADASRAAEVVQNGIAASFTLPRTVSLSSDMQREQKTRITTIDFKPTYTYVTRPAVDPQAFLRGLCRNDSGFQLLSGVARVFLGGESVGITTLPDVAPGTDVELWFGADKRIAVERQLIAKNTSTSGLLSKSDDVVWQYRIDLRSALPTQASMEVWDRMPVSRNEKISVKLSDVSPGLAIDKKYEANEKTKGLLKWSLNLPPRVAGMPPALVSIHWTVTLSKPEKTLITPLPE